MKKNGIKRVSKWRRYLNIILGINYGKQSHQGIAASGVADPSSSPKGAAGDRISDDRFVSAGNTAHDDADLQYCMR